MNQAFADLLPTLLPSAIAWAEAQQQQTLARGQQLDALAQALARSVGVRHPERIRLEVFDVLPVPKDAELRAATVQAGLLGSGTIGLTLGYAVLVRSGWETDGQLLSHEFRHVQQYEQLGSVRQFLPVYLEQIARFGYDDAPLEIDARDHERDHP